MLPNYVYHPILFYFITISTALLIGPLAAFLKQKGMEPLQMPFVL